MVQLDPKDGGLASRKFIYSIGTSVLVFLGALIAAKWPAFGSNYEAMIGGLLGVLTLYLGGNISGKWMFARQITAHADAHVKIAQADAQAEPAAPEEKPDA